jgi:membrane protein implicated in regulation of membrane protease activity
MSAWHYWLLAGIVLAIAEIFAPGFVLICFGLGACIASLFTYLFGFGPEGQFLSFGVATLIVFAGSRTLFHDVLWPSENPDEATNVDALVGRLATVEEAIPQGDGRGMVRIGGEQWTAVSSDRSAMAVGSRVKVQAIEGNKLLVTQVREDGIS